MTNKEKIWDSGIHQNHKPIFGGDLGGTSASGFNDLVSMLTNKTQSNKINTAINVNSIADRIEKKRIEKQEKINSILTKANEKRIEKQERITGLLDLFSSKNEISKKEKVLNLIEEIILLLNGRSSLLRENTVILLNKIKSNIEFENIDIRYNELNELKKSIIKEKKEDVVDLSSCINAFKSL